MLDNASLVFPLEGPAFDQGKWEGIQNSHSVNELGNFTSSPSMPLPLGQYECFLNLCKPTVSSEQLFVVWYSFSIECFSLIKLKMFLREIFSLYQWLVIKYLFCHVFHCYYLLSISRNYYFVNLSKYIKLLIP